MFLRRIKAEKERGKQRINPNITRQPAVLLSSTEPRLHIFLFQISSYLHSLYTELHKFAVAMEAIIQNDPKSVSLNETNDYLIQVLAKSKFCSLNIYIYI